MSTGIVETTGRVTAIRDGDDGSEQTMTVRCSEAAAELDPGACVNVETNVLATYADAEGGA